MTIMYTDISTSAVGLGNEYPKTLFIRNSKGGMVWQIYHVNNQSEVEQLSSNAYGNGFYGTTLEDYAPEEKETWEDWRETEGGKEIIDSSNINV